MKMVCFPDLLFSLPPRLIMVLFTRLIRGEIRFGSRSLREIGGLTGVLSEQDEENFVAFIQSMLALEPDDRPEAWELLSAPWLVDNHSMS